MRKVKQLAGFILMCLAMVGLGFIWVISSLSQPVKEVVKCDVNFNIIKRQTTPKMPQTTEGASMQYPRVSCGTDYIFFSTSSTGTLEPVWKYHFETNKAVAMDKMSFYNAIGYNDAKGTLYIGQMKEYDVSGTKLREIANHSVYGASFPAGIWFTHDFDRW